MGNQQSPIPQHQLRTDPSLINNTPALRTKTKSQPHLSATSTRPNKIIPTPKTNDSIGSKMITKRKIKSVHKLPSSGLVQLKTNPKPPTHQFLPLLSLSAHPPPLKERHKQQQNTRTKNPQRTEQRTLLRKYGLLGK